MIEHDLKVWPQFFEPLDQGLKTFEIRLNDRGYLVGDTLRLREYEPGPDKYTGRERRSLVVYLLNGDDPMGYAFGLRPGYVAMSLEPA